MLAELRADLRQLSLLITGRCDWRSQCRVALCYESFAVTVLQRLRRAVKALHIVGLHHALKTVQRVAYGIEIGREVELGHGVWFIHPTAVVIGGNAKIGDRVRFFGSNTLGKAKEDGYPTIEEDVWVGAGARILGPITVGARSVIGANAVVLQDVPPDSVAVGIPARSKAKKADFPARPV